jgi:hypothetical protein
VRRRLHLTIIGYPARLDATLETIARTLLRGSTEDRVVERAQQASDVRFLVRQWHFRDRALHGLDLVGHGEGGRFQLGDELLFGGDGAGLELVEQWRPFLHERATLRLLGCSVATRPGGRALLKQLQTRLGGRRRALAPTRPLFDFDYGPRGLTARALRCLAGSTTPRRP